MEIKFFGLYISDQNIKETFLKKEFIKHLSLYNRIRDSW
jgi:hypothetical protein